jgi:hypothetical protein
MELLAVRLDLFLYTFLAYNLIRKPVSDSVKALKKCKLLQADMPLTTRVRFINLVRKTKYRTGGRCHVYCFSGRGQI